MDAAEINQIKNTPAFVVDEDLLRHNLMILESIRKNTGVKILQALKGFAMHSLAKQSMSYLDGVCASGVNEAALGAEFYGKEVHVYSPGFKAANIPKLVQTSDHVIFNSLGQFRALHKIFLEESLRQKKALPIQFGLRVNHEYSEIDVEIYNPCAQASRFGILVNDLSEVTAEEWGIISGLHFHTMCEQGADVLFRTVKVIREKLGDYLHHCKFLNLGGGHHITKPGYDINLLESILVDLQRTYQCQVYLEPGEAVALNTGFLVASVVDIVHNEMDIAILDTSATAHMPDVIEMPYRPEIIGSQKAFQQPHTYRLGGSTCLAGDVIGDYSFKHPLSIGGKLVFMDMAHYTMVKTTQFNGIGLPDIGILQTGSRRYKVIRKFGYQDYKNLLS